MASDGVNSLDAALQQALFKPPTLVTPTAAEKLLGDEYALITEVIEKPDKRPVIGPEGDRRSVWEGKPPEAMFDVEGDE